MIILSDCLTTKADEGCIKVASNLTERIKAKHPHTKVISYNRRYEHADKHFKLNQFFLNYNLLRTIYKEKTTVLYIPKSSNTFACSVRCWVLGCVAKWGFQVIFASCNDMNYIVRTLLQWSGVQIVTLSRESYNSYQGQLNNNVLYLKTGVDTNVFYQIDESQKEKLRDKYGIKKGKKVVLHVGHLNTGRNISQLFKINSNYHVFLVVSTETKDEREQELREYLMTRPNTTIFDTYIKHIEEIYQIADVYLFPVIEKGNCIDVPLSVLEAASCNVPIIATRYGELKEFEDEDGFCFIDSFESDELNKAIDKMSALSTCNNRNAVLKYDWDTSIERDIRV